ncbi:hypothetical protein [Photobacterium kasasachensis]|uniref:hypothetical protein n=1 Tax=Photobacterium kasasachensis TaxID=2910240 RepID=UPI003D0F7D6E
MHEYCRIKKELARVLAEFGFQEVKPDFETDCYGSTYCIFANREKRYMILWDGEERFGSVEAWENSCWIALDTIVTESNELEFRLALSTLCNELIDRLSKDI